MSKGSPLAILGLLFAGSALTADLRPSHAPWNQLVEKYVNAQARVDYSALKVNDLGTLDAYLAQLAQPWTSDVSPQETKAALLNAYNALTVRWIIANYPVESIWRTSHPFTEARHTVNGAKVSLDQIETRLRNMGDPRVHAAMVCASLSCPPLRREAYVAGHLDQQLDDNAAAWLANGRLNTFLPDQHLAKVSMIFQWYAGDFEKSVGSVAKFLAAHGPFGKTNFLLTGPTKIEYIPYNWGINDVSNLGARYSGLKFYWDAMKNKYF